METVEELAHSRALVEVAGTAHPVLEAAVGLALVIGVIFLHGVGIRVISRRFSQAWSRVTIGSGGWRVNLLLVAAVGALAALHLVEALLIAAPLYLRGLLPTMRDSFYFALECYTTLGMVTNELPESWRLIGPMIGIAGLFAFGWTGGVLVDIMSRYGKLDSLQARQQVRAAQAADAGGAPGPRTPS